jgi:predicted dehydrogenase
MDRRTFLMGTAAAGAIRASQLASPNDTVRVACVGVRGQGAGHIRNYSRMKNVEVAAIVDVDEKILSDRVGSVEKGGAKRPKGYSDIREMLQDKEIDVVSIATPNHWHTLMTIWALQAGKDVYVEKPCAYNMFESRQMVNAVRKYKDRVVQHGANSRSGPAVQEAVQHMKDGLIGDVYLARGLCFKWRNTIQHTPVEAVPSGFNYDLWTGPAPLKPFTKNRYHYNWHWFWDFGNGDLGNQGIHELDICRWGLGVNYPTKVTAIGGKFMFDDDQETPNTITALYEFDGGPTGKKKMMEFAVRHWITNHEAGINDGRSPEGKLRDRNTIGNIFYGSKGYIAIEGYTTYSSFLGPNQDPGPARREGGNNWQNFIDVVRSRDKSKLNAPADDAAASCALIHLANISYQLGRTVNFDEKTWTCPGDKQATAMFTRKEGYRKPYVVPDIKA